MLKLEAEGWRIQRQSSVKKPLHPFSAKPDAFRPRMDYTGCELIIKCTASASAAVFQGRLAGRRKEMGKEFFSNCSRREMAKSAFLSGVSCLAGATLLHAEGAAGSKGLLDVRQFGAKGDGKEDDTKAIQKAIDAAAESHGAVFVPPGVY
jgi:hypothetical protein